MTTATAPTTAPVGLLTGYRVLLRWQLARIGTVMLPLVVIVRPDGSAGAEGQPAAAPCRRGLDGRCVV